MNPIQLYEYGKSRGSYNAPNLFIGGVASTINTPELLADKFQNYASGSAFSVSNIQDFTIVGDDIKCYIAVDYQLNNTNPFTSAQIGAILTYYYDFQRLKSMASSFSGQTNLKYLKLFGLINIGPTSGSLGNCNNLEILDFPNLITWNDNSSINKPESLKIVNIPKCTILGGTAGDNNLFYFTYLNFKIYANTYLQTNNSGGLEGDLVGFTNITWVLNETPPNPITDLSIGAVYGTSAQLNFTAPTGNAIDYYEVYANGVYKNNIQGSGGYCKGLSLDTTYTFEVKPVDVYYNKSTSNTVSQKTNASEPYPVSNIVSYYKMEGNVLDSFGSNNGTPTAIAYAAGTVGQQAVFNGNTSKINAASSDFDFFGTAKLSMIAVINLSSLPASGKTYGIAAIQDTNPGIVDKVIRITSTGEAIFYVFDGAVRNATSAAGEISINTDYVLIGTYDGVNIKIYINGTLKATLAASGTYNMANSILAISHISGTEVGTNGKIDEVAVLNTDLTQIQISEITSKLLSGQSLI